MTRKTLEFAGFTLDLDRLCLFGPAGQPGLRPKSFEVLRYLLEHPGRVVSKDEVMTAVWPNTTVSDESLTRCVSDVRRALGDGQQHIIKTVPRRGYLVDVPVVPVPGATAVASNKGVATPTTARARDASDKTLESVDKPASAGERKQVTVLCANFRTTLAAAAEHDPEQALAVFEAALDLITEAVGRYEGTVNVVTAHGAVALFGVPRTQEDHAIRACHAALQIQGAVRRYARTSGHAIAESLLVQIGLNSGELVTRASLGRSPGEYRAMGHTTELAARLEQVAPPGTTLLSGETLRLAEGHIRAQAFAAADPHNGLVYELVDVGPAQSRFQAAAARGLTGFAGRDAEMAQLARIEARVRQGNGQVVAVIGEPGVGKSRLLYEFFQTQRQGETLMLETASVSYRKTTSYLPIIALLQRYFGIDDRDGVGVVRDKVVSTVLALDPALAADLPPLLGLLEVPVEDEHASWYALDSTQRRQRTLDALKRLILREAHRRPLMLAFEDLHWIDGESQAFLETLIDGLTQAPLLLFLTYRPEYRHGWGGKSCYTQVRLNAFEGKTSEEFLANLVGGDATLERLKAVLPADGNPLFLEESVRSLVETKVIEGAPGNYRLVGQLRELRMPATVQAILAARIDRLSLRGKELLQAASVIGTQVPQALLRPLVGLTEEDLGAGLAELRDGEFFYEARLIPNVEYAFKHALTHDVAYGSLLGERRRALHRRCLEVIRHLSSDRLPEVVEQLAHHAVRGEVWDEAVVYLRHAGRKAAAKSAPDDARACLEQALGILEASPASAFNLQQALEARLELRPVLNQLGEPRRMLELLHEAETMAERLNDDRQRGRVCAFMATTHCLLGELDEAIATSTRATEIAAELGDLELRILGTSFLAQAHYYRGDYEAVVKVATNNLAVLPADWTYEYFGNVAPASVFDRAWLAMALAQLGRFGEAARQEAEAIRLAEPMQHAFTLGRAYLASGTLYPLQGSVDSGIPPHRVLDRGGANGKRGAASALGGRLFGLGPRRVGSEQPGARASRRRREARRSTGRTRYRRAKRLGLSRARSRGPVAQPRLRRPAACQAGDGCVDRTAWLQSACPPPFGGRCNARRRR